jgi:hypothetical protein
MQPVQAVLAPCQRLEVALVIEPLRQGQIFGVAGEPVNVSHNLHDATMLGLEHLADLRIGARLEHGATERIHRASFNGSPALPMRHSNGSVCTMSAVNEIPSDWLAEFEAAARRPLPQRFRYAFVRTYKPVLDDARYRSFDSMEDYRRWCEENLPDWLGYGRI